MSQERRALVVLGLVLNVASAAAGAEPPSIRAATLAPDTGVITIAGEHLGPDVLVIVDGQPVTTLPGASDTRVQVQAPASVASTPGAYRLVVFDSIRRAWDGFVVVSVPGVSLNYRTPAGPDDSAAPGRGRSGPTGTTATSLAPPFSPTSSTSLTPVPLTVVEDSGSPFRTALGFQALLSNTTGLRNTGLGFQALQTNTTSSDSTGVGYLALKSSTGSANTALGASALAANTNGVSNTAVGRGALQANLGGDFNTGVGSLALSSLTAGNENTAVGEIALRFNVSGINNVAVGNAALQLTAGDANTGIGRRAGTNNTAGSYNIYLGADVTGSGTDANTMRLGLPFTGSAGQNKTFIAGIRGTTVTAGDGVYIDANGQLGSGPVVPAADTVGSAQVIADSLTAADLAAASVGTSELADGSVTVAKMAFPVAGLGANTFAGTQTIGAGNLALDASTATTGNMSKGGVRFLSNPGFMNTFLGQAAGSLAVTGNTNTATGGDALRSVVAGSANMASGYGALFLNVAGSGNTASGMQALFSATGSNNTAVGVNAGTTVTSGAHNIYLGANVIGTSTDANTMRLGLPYNGATGEGQNQTFIAGIYGTQLTTPAQQVFVDVNGQLGILGPPVTTGSGTVSPGVNPPDVAALIAEVHAQRTTIDALLRQMAAMQADIAALGAAAPAARRP